MTNCYADLTTLKSASYLNISVTTHDTYFLRLLDAASRQVDEFCRRFFYCWEGTRLYEGAGDKFFCPDDILSITTIKLDEDDDDTYETTLTVLTDYLLYPKNSYPKTWLEISSNTGRQITDFADGCKSGIQIIGVFGYGDGKTATPYVLKTTTAEALDASETDVDVTSATALSAGNTIRVESEQMYIESISSNTLTVRRGENGTTAATHATSKDLYVYEYPLPVYQATLIQAMRMWKRKDSAYQDVVGLGDLGTISYTKGFDVEAARLLSKYVRGNV